MKRSMLQQIILRFLAMVSLGLCEMYFTFAANSGDAGRSVALLSAASVPDRPYLLYEIVAPTNKVTFKAPAIFVIEVVRSLTDGSVGSVSDMSVS